MSVQVLSVTKCSNVKESFPEVCIATTQDQYSNSFRMAYHAYRSLGWIPANADGLRVTPNHLKSSTIVFNAYRENELVGTLSLFEDDGELPSAEGWGPELARLRRQYRGIFELGALMVRPGEAFGHRIWLALFKYAWLYARGFRRSDALCAFVVARHVAFYRSYLGFHRFGEDHNHRCNNVVVSGVAPIYMRLEGAEGRFRRRYEIFGDSPKNLYRFFVQDDRVECESLIAESLRVRERPAFQYMLREFVPFLPSMARADNAAFKRG